MGGAAHTAPGNGQGRSRGNLQCVSGEEGKHGQREDMLRGGVRKRRQPQGSAGEDEQVAHGVAAQGESDKSTIREKMVPPARLELATL